MLILTYLNHLHPDPRYSLIKAYFPERSDDQHQALLFKWVSPGKDKTVFSAPYLGDILDQLGTEEDGREFQDLKAKVDEERRVEYVLSRVGFSRAKAAHFTPSVIKKLRPPNAVLTWQMTSFCFQAYYPIPQALRTKAAEKLKEEQEKKTGKGKGKTQRKVKTHWARSRSYKEKRTKLDALVWVVEWLWKTHKQQGGDTRGWFSELICGFRICKRDVWVSILLGAQADSTHVSNPTYV